MPSLDSERHRLLEGTSSKLQSFDLLKIIIKVIDLLI